MENYLKGEWGMYWKREGSLSALCDGPETLPWQQFKHFYGARLLGYLNREQGPL